MAEIPAARNKASRLDVWWPLTFGVTIGVEIMLSALVLFGPAPMKPEIAAQLSNLGRLYFVPEHDLGIYTAGCVLTVLLTVGFAWIWQSRARALERNGASDDARAVFLHRGCGNLSVGAALFLVQLGLLLLVQRWGAVEAGRFPFFLVGVLALPVIGSLIVATIGGSWNLGIAPGWFVRLLTASAAGREFSRPCSNRWFDVIVPILICAVIYIPEWRNFFGWYFQATVWCRHWDSFVVGPMLAFHYGKALGTEVYSQYGVGWPVVYSVLHGFSPLTIPRFLHVAIMCGCIYFIGVYVFLRLALRNVVWAAAGVLLAILLQLYYGLEPHEFLWEWPSSTILRSPMDIWFFIVVLLHLRTGRTAWAIAAGAFTGLAVFFETDTGIHLTLTWGTYWILVLAMKWQSGRSYPALLRQMLISLITALVILLAGLAVASRGTLLHPEFWRGWLEAILTYSSGMSMLPIAKVPPGSLVLFALFITVYLCAVGLVVIKLFCRALVSQNVLLGCLAAYGLLALLLFVSRSETSKIFHASVAFSLIVTLVAARSFLGGKASENAAKDGRNEDAERPGTGSANEPGVTTGNLVRRFAPWCALLGVGVWLVVNPRFRYYPGALQTLFAGSPMRDVKGPQPEDIGFIPEFGPVVSLLRQQVAAGRTFAVLDGVDPLFYLAAGAAPWWRFAPSLGMIIRQSEIADLRRAIVTRGPEIVVIRASGEFARGIFYDEEDVWHAVHQTVADHYHLELTVGNFEFWRRKGK